MTELDENGQVVNLVQAMIGAITSRFRAVSIMDTSTAVRLYFLLASDTAEDREEIDEIVFEFEALQPSRIAVDVDVIVDDRPLADVDLPGRLVFARKEPA